MTNVTDKQWETIKKRAKAITEEYIVFPADKDIETSEIHEQGGAGFEQRAYIGNYILLESHIQDIVQEETGAEDGRMVDGFYDLVIEIVDGLGEQFEVKGGFHTYTEDGDIWLARSWDTQEEIPEDLQNLIYPY